MISDCKATIFGNGENFDCPGEYPGLTVFSGEKRKTVTIKKSNKSRYIGQVDNC